MAMLPFCGYNMADYFQHWLNVGKGLKHPPKIFRVNWFRTGENGKFLWPGFGDNLRVLDWVLERCAGRGEAVDTPIGNLPTINAISRKGLDVSDEIMKSLLQVDSAEWMEAVTGQQDFLNSFGRRMPKAMWDEHDKLSDRIEEKASSAAAPIPDYSS
jgi:phosphoenolpyruvate carboxykinase (GTP)